MRDYTDQRRGVEDARVARMSDALASRGGWEDALFGANIAQRRAAEMAGHIGDTAAGSAAITQQARAASRAVAQSYADLLPLQYAAAGQRGAGLRTAGSLTVGGRDARTRSRLPLANDPQGSDDRLVKRFRRPGEGVCMMLRNRGARHGPAFVLLADRSRAVPVADIAEIGMAAPVPDPLPARLRGAGGVVMLDPASAALALGVVMPEPQARTLLVFDGANPNAPPREEEIVAWLHCGGPPWPITVSGLHVPGPTKAARNDATGALTGLGDGTRYPDASGFSAALRLLTAEACEGTATGSATLH